MFDLTVGKTTLKIPCLYCVLEEKTRLTTETVINLELDYLGEIVYNKQALFVKECPYCKKPIYVQILGRLNIKNGECLEKGQTYYNVFYKDNYYMFSSKGKTIPIYSGHYKMNEKGDLELL